MNVVPTEIPDVLLLEPDVFGDARGFFLETYHQKRYQDAGIKDVFVQDNHSRSERHVLRGLHYQWQHLQGKLIYALSGNIWDVAVDIRYGSPTFGKQVGVLLTAENHRQLYVPAGFAHGFVVLTDWADVCYKCTDLYYPEFDAGVVWNDPDLAVNWHVDAPLLSAKDGRLPRLSEIPPEKLPVYHG
jgi:dTDP-4-dehydrorhamnose 3,5-epimerase